MSLLKVYKEISALPSVLEADAIYMVRVGAGFDLYVTDTTGSIAYASNGYVPEVSPNNLSLGESYAAEFRDHVKRLGAAINPSNAGHRIGKLIQDDLFKSASLVLFPSAVAEGKLYAQKPLGLAMDVSRASTGTRRNFDGLVELAPYNLVRYSQEISNTGYWAHYVADLTADTTIAPDGTTSADTITLTSTGGSAYQFVNYGAGIYTLSCYFKKINEDNFYIDGNSSAGYYGASFNLTTLATSTFAGGFSPEIENVGNGWFRCSVRGYASGSGSYGFGVNAGAGQSAYIWGAQLVEGSSARTYQRTENCLNVPRIDHDDDGLPSILVEPQRTNLALYSSQFDSVYWDKSSGSITANAGTAPDGTNSADLYTANGTNNNHDFFQGFTGGAETTASIFVRKSTARYVYISLNYQNSGVNWATGIYDLDDLTTATFQSGGVTNPIARIRDEGDGWRRIVLSVATANTALFCMYGVADSMSPAFSVRGRVENASTNSFYAWGAQFEAGSYATSHMPTTSASVTRVADVVRKTGISHLIGQTEGVIFYDFVLSTTGVDFTLGNLYSSSNGNSYSLLYINPSNAIGASVLNNGAVECEIVTSSLSLGRHKIAFAYKANDFAVFIDGVLQGTDTSGSVPAMDEFNLIGYNLAPSAYRQTVKISAAALWKTRLPNAVLAKLTAL